MMGMLTSPETPMPSSQSPSRNVGFARWLILPPMKAPMASPPMNVESMVESA